MIFVRWIPSFIQFWISITGLQIFAMKRAIEADSRSRSPNCPCVSKASPRWRCAKVFSETVKVLSAVSGMEGTLVICAILSSYASYRYTLILTGISLAGAYAWYLFRYLEDPRRIALFTKVSKHKIVRKFSGKISRNDLTALIVLLSGLVASVLAEILGAP